MNIENLKKLYKILEEQLTMYEDFDGNKEVDDSICSAKDEIENFLLEKGIEVY